MVVSIPPAPHWFLERLEAYSQKVGCEISKDQAKLLKLHAEWLFFWNRVTNLTAAKTWDELIIRHYLDSIIVAQRWLPKSGKMLDIGSGAGFPGIPIKIMLPELEILLCELRRRKVSFLKSFISFAGLKGINVLRASWEEIVEKDPLVFDLITWRAIRIEHADIVDIANRGLKPGGVMVYWTTPSNLRDLGLTNNSCSYEEGGIIPLVFDYSLPGNINRAIVMFKKEQPKKIVE
ncbi:MAG: 16S rRNA (guanine(527)-N(7))-methyltransferase RsmG [Syntrophobacterales bacterium]|nr:16S rRNA (guanine(527)-N(7))-methyltransferase RsmG [Syntrophobacterales bacterium]